MYMKVRIKTFPLHISSSHLLFGTERRAIFFISLFQRVKNRSSPGEIELIYNLFFSLLMLFFDRFMKYKKIIRQINVESKF